MKTAGIVLEELCALIGKYTRLSRDQINPNVPFLEMGADSMVLVRAVREIEKMYGVKITIRALYEKMNNLNALAQYVVESSRREERGQPAEGVKYISENTPEIKAAAPAAVGAALREHSVDTVEEYVIEPPSEIKSTPPKKSKKVSWQTAKPETSQRDYSSNQQQHLEDLIRRYTRKTKKSKAIAQEYRSCLADSKATVGFRMSVKEMLYPIVGAKTQGSRLWDVDGNEYVDITMGFGAQMFGYRPGFIMDTLKTYLEEGVQLGPRSPVLGETARLLCEMTGSERVAFANTGTEANMAVLRLVRSATGKSRIAMFRDSYHGHSDYTLAEGQFELEDGTLVGVTPGIPKSVLGEVLVLDYDDPSALDKIIKHQDELAGVIVEPVQSRNPLVQPGEFLRSLRELTSSLDIPLIFDEMITGFRCHPGGAQGLFGVKADIATYGKAIGGGLPIGVIAGKAKYLDGIDGGFWQYGDESFPQMERTFFGGTYCQHPMVIPVVNSMLKHIKARGPELQESLSKKTAAMADALNEYFESNGIPIRVARFASVFRFEMVGNLDLFYYYMIERGVYIWEWRLCFLTDAHTEEDIAFIVQAAKESAEDLRRGGFLPAGTPEPKGLSYTPPEEIKALTDEQKQLWTISKFGAQGEGAGAYNVILSLKIDGEFYANVMKNALQRIVDRYETLRSTVDSERVVQVIHKSYKIDLKVESFESYKEGEKKQAVDSWLYNYNGRVFDLSSAPAFEAVVLTLGPKEHILALKAHHMFVDGVSLGIILEELAEIYSAGCEIRAPRLQESVNDYSFDPAEEAAKKDNLSFWLRKFERPVQACNLPYDNQRPLNRIHRGADKQILISDSLYKQISSLAIKSNVSVYMVLLTLYASFMQRVCGSEEVVVSTPTSGRFSEGAERLVGHYAAILPVRVAAEGDLTFEEQLKKTSADVMEIFEYQNFSFPDLCEAVKKQWPELVGPNKFPMSPILFNYDNMGEAPSLSGATASYYISPVIHYVDSDIYFNFIDMQSRMLLDCHYSADLFSEQTAGRLLDSFVAFMERALGNLSKKIKDLDIVTAGEKKTLLEKFNQSILPYIESSGENVAQSSVVERFYSVAGRAPESAALISENARMTYRELNEKTSQTARMLLESGVKRGDAVGIVMERSFEMLIAILGILKAGGAYLPIDPNYPANRIAYMLKDCAVSVVVTQSKFEKAAGGDGAIKVVVWEDAKLEGYATDNLPATPEARDPAYIIYTSGSTGEPKGVMIEHRSLYNIINYTVERLGLTQNDTALIRGPYCFDGTVFECFTWFFSGSGIFVLPAEDEKNPLRILDIIERYKIRFCFFAPSMLNVLLSFMEEKGGNAMKSVKYLVTGGEALSAATINKFHSLTDKAALVDIYGPTEAAIYATTYTHNRKESPPRTVIGFPVANAGIYILDEALKLVPAGVTGEICISGAGLARGYINKPELTGEKFVDNPYLPGEKMYRTGDRGRWLPDGAIEYRGRNDGQVKVRGFRVELGEIEARILGYDRVRETAVKKLTDSNGMDYLCAYLSADGEITPEEMRAHLSRDLPEHMIPSRYVFIKKMPKNHNDKIDRASLPEPLEAESHDAPAQGARESSMSETEKKVMAIWQNLLKNRNIGVGDNFFNIGGDSLKAAMMMMHLQREFKSTIPLNEIFNNTSVRSLSSYIDSLG